MTAAIEKMFNEEIREMKRTARGAYSKASANGHTRGRALSMALFMRGFETTDVSVTRGGKTVIVPASYYTKSGALKKSKRDAYEALFK